jgi:DNA mismatch repair ATPase MutS
MESGKLDEELGRMSAIVDKLAPGAMVLFNESFATTNEREGSEIATQVIEALLQRDIKLCFVTHLYEFARHLHDKKMHNAIFLRAERHTDGTRTFRVIEGEPLQTSYGPDLYKTVFASDPPLASERYGTQSGHWLAGTSGSRGQPVEVTTPDKIS